MQYEDGDHSNAVRADDVRYAPERPAGWGKGALRGNDLLPEGAKQVNIGKKAPKDMYGLLGPHKRTQIEAAERIVRHYDEWVTESRLFSYGDMLVTATY